MVRVIPLLLLVGLLLTDAAADPGRGYPRVYGPTGRPYGPTQAHYQYERQYGHSWHGAGGQSGGGSLGHVNGYPGGGYYYSAPVYGYGWGGPGWGGYGWGGYGFNPYAVPYGNGGYFPGGFGSTGSYVIVPTPALVQPEIYQHLGSNSAIQDALRENRQQWETPLEQLPLERPAGAIMRPSTDAAKIASLGHEHRGDLQLQKSAYFEASGLYRQAIAAAEDRAAPHMKLGIVEAARERYGEAIRQLKIGLQLDPTWPYSGTTLANLFGVDRLLGKTLVLQRIADWTQEDIRDPDRLFVLGTFMHLDGDTQRAATVFETAARLSGMQPHLAAFLRPVPAAPQPGLRVDPAPAAEQAVAPGLVLPELPRDAGAVITTDPPVKAPLGRPTPEPPQETSPAAPELEGPALP